MRKESEMSSIPKGYKKTELGIIPEEWDVVTFKLAVAKVEAGTSVNSWNQTAYCGSVGILKTSCISSGIFEKIENKRVIDQDISRVTCPLVEGRIIVSRMNTPMLVGMLAIVPKDNYSGLYLPDRLWSLSVNANYFDAHFVHHWGHTQQYRQDVTTASDGTSDSMKNISKSNFLALYIPQPPLPEQKAIAKALSDMDALIEAQKELIAKKRDIKQGTMQDLLSGRVRLPGYETKGWKHTDIGDIPDDWKLRKLGETCLCDMNTLSSSTDPNYSFTYISLECVDSGILTNTFEYIFSKAPSRARKIVHQYNVLISTVRPNLKSHYYQSSPCENLICSTGFTVLQTNNNVGKFIFYHFFSNIINKQIETIVSGSNYPSISTQDVASLQIPLPPFSEQKAIAQVLSDMDDEIETLEAELEKLNHMKRGMMQELLTGRIRLI